MNGAAFALLVLAGACLAGEAFAATHVVEIEGMAFVPATLDVQAGDVIEWRNEDVVPHTATSAPAGIDLVLAAGETGSTRIERSGEFDVICRFHPQMRLRLVAEESHP